MAYSEEKDLFPFIGTDEDTDIIVFFTDGENEPKKLNVRRCIEGNTDFLGNYLGYAGDDLKDFFSACPKTPEKAIQFSWIRESGKTSNFSDTNGFQFAYQNIYVDGFVSSISVISEVAYPPSIQSLGAKSISNAKIENNCILEIPKQSPEVDAVKILFREGNEGAFKLIDEVSNLSDISNDDFDFFDDEGILGYYSFRNDGVYAVVPAEQVKKNFDNLPRKARAQTVSANRLMYGNYLDGFDNVPTAAEVETVFEGVEQQIGDNVTAAGNAVTSINVLTDLSRVGADGIDVRGENAGFIIDVGTDDIAPGTYSLSIDLAPEKNFHLYSSQSYLSSRNQVFNDTQGFYDDDINVYGGGTNYRTVHRVVDPEEGAYPVSNSGNSFLYGHKLGAKGIAEMTWRTSPGENITVQLGTTPANPLILRGSALSFDIELNVTETVTAAEFMSAIDSVITTGETGSLKIGFIDYTGFDVNFGEFGLTEDGGATGVFTVMETNAGLSKGRKFGAADENAELICKVPMETDPQGSNTLYDDWGVGLPGSPMGFFIVNKATTILNVEKVSPIVPVVPQTTDGTSPIQNQGSLLQTDTRKYYRIVPKFMRVDDIVTCLPEPVEGLGWGVTYQESGEVRYETGSQIPWGLRGTYSQEPNTDTGLQYYQFFWPMVRSVVSATGGVYGTGFTAPFVPLKYTDPGFQFGVGDVNMNLMPDPQVVNGTYRFKRANGTPYIEFDAMVTAFNNSQNKITVSEPTITMVVGDGWWEGFFTLDTVLATWSCSLVDADNGSVDTTNINYPSELGVRNRNGSLEYFGDSLMQPIAIGAWTVFDGNDGYDSDEYFFEISKSQGDHKLSTQDTATMLPPMSRGWDGHPVGNTLIFNPDSYNGEISMIDGSGGLGGENGPAFSTEIFISKGAGDLYPGGLGTDVAFDPDTEPNSGAEKPVSNRRGTVWNTGLVGIIENMRYIHPDVEYSPGFASEERQPYNDPTDPTDADRTSTPFTDLGSFLSVGVDGEALSSFKTRDYHDFGIVYYDQRGRAGYVNSLPSAYVPGYSDAERGEGQKGRVAVKYKLLHAPPEWADSYRIVYSGSANTYRFIQYSAGGAFTEPSSSGGADSSIYVSLNYLQGKKASYAGSFGAVDQDTGENVLYRYTPGDKLRVISYYTDDETIVYAPADFEFDVIGVEEISEESESPLYDENELYEDENLERIRRSGSFVLLRNNVSADGFNAFAVGAGTDFWRNRCIFEIYSPRKSRGDEQIPYYETPFGGKIVTQNGTRIHQYGTITIDQGDVFFRQVPVNINSYNATDQKFNEILSAEENTSGGYPVDTSESRFKGYFLESNSAIDLFRSNAKSYGKMHFKVDGARERLNDSSIIYSAPTNQESFNLFYTSFSPVIKNYFDLPNKHGDIDYISDFGSDLFFAQNSKVGFLQVERSLTSTAAGQDTVNISSDVIGSPRYFPEDVGTDGHPESVTVTNASALFVDKSRGLVVTAGLRGMDILSSADMTTFFKNMLEVYPEDVRIVTGFNPRTEEYIVSMFDPSLSNSIIDPSNSINQYELAEDGVNTYAYDVKGKAWVTSYSFHSTEYSSVGDVFVSYKSMPIDDQDYGACIWKHDDEKKNSFYGSTYPSYFKSVLSQNPNSSKDYRSVSIDGTDPWDLKLYTTKELSTITNFTAYEDTYYSDVLRSENTSSKTNTKSVGVVVDFDARGRDVRLTFKRDISQYHITLSEEEEIAKCYFLGASGGSLADFTTSTGRKVIMTPRKVIGKNQLQITLRPELSDFELLEVKNFVTGRTLVVSSSSRFYGDSLRDKYLCIEARLTPSENQRPELYSINVDYIPSFLDSSR